MSKALSITVILQKDLETNETEVILQTLVQKLDKESIDTIKNYAYEKGFTYSDFNSSKSYCMSPSITRNTLRIETGSKKSIVDRTLVNTLVSDAFNIADTIEYTNGYLVTTELYSYDIKKQYSEKKYFILQKDIDMLKLEINFGYSNDCDEIVTFVKSESEITNEKKKHIDCVVSDLNNLILDAQKQKESL